MSGNVLITIPPKRGIPSCAKGGNPTSSRGKTKGIFLKK